VKDHHSHPSRTIGLFSCDNAHFPKRAHLHLGDSDDTDHQGWPVAGCALSMNCWEGSRWFGDDPPPRLAVDMFNGENAARLSGGCGVVMVVTCALSHQRDRPYLSAMKDALNPGPGEAEQGAANDQ
jgi:hypothetical protein